MFLADFQTKPTYESGESPPAQAACSFPTSWRASDSEVGDPKLQSSPYSYIYIWANYNDLTATEPWKS